MHISVCVPVSRGIAAIPRATLAISSQALVVSDCDLKLNRLTPLDRPPRLLSVALFR